MDTISFKRHRFPPEIIQRAVWLYARFALSYRDVEDLLAERGRSAPPVPASVRPQVLDSAPREIQPPSWPWRTSRRSLPFFESSFLLLWVGQRPSGNEGRLAGADDAGGSKFGALGISSLPGVAFRSVFGPGRLRGFDTVRIEGRGGRLIRHAGPVAAAFPVVPLPVAVIEPSFRALLVPPVGVPPLLPPGFSPASLGAVPVAPVTMTADPEHRATAGAPANPLTQEFFAGPPPRPCGGTGQPRPVMAISIPSADDVGSFFRASTKTPDRQLTAGRGFPFPTSATPYQSLGKPHR